MLPQTDLVSITIKNPAIPLRKPVFAFCAFALCVLPVLAQEQPDQFSTRLPIITEAAMPYYRLNLPIQAYQSSVHGDLRDLRVFNATGQSVPYALLAATGSTEESIQRQKLVWYPLYAPSSAQQINTADDSELKIVVKQAGDGTLVEINNKHANSAKPGTKAGATPLRGYVLDASTIKERQTVKALELDWEKSGGDFQLLDLETSDDLQHWHNLAANVQLARLDYNGAKIENRRIDLRGFSDRYLRLVWREPVTAPKLTSAELVMSSSHYQNAPLAWSSSIAGTSDSDLKPGEYRFRLAQPLPLARLRVDLPPGNQLLPLEVLTPGRDRRHWHTLTNSVAYRINSKGHEWSNTEIILSGYPLQEFVLRIDPRLNPLTQNPQLAYALQPAQIIFLASGTAPYTLAVGHKEAKAVALPATTLIPGFGKPSSPDISDASIAINTMQVVSTGSAQAVTSTQDMQYNWKKIALWSVLILGVIGMAGMAWQLVRQMKQT